MGGKWVDLDSAYNLKPLTACMPRQVVAKIPQGLKGVYILLPGQQTALDGQRAYYWCLYKGPENILLSTSLYTHGCKLSLVPEQSMGYHMQLVLTAPGLYIARTLLRGVGDLCYDNVYIVTSLVIIKL